MSILIKIIIGVSGSIIVFAVILAVSTYIHFRKIAITNVRRNIRIILRDGAIVRANLFLPPGAGSGRRYPAIVTALPYQKDGLGGALTVVNSYSLARDGYAYLVVDLRGTGASDGCAQHPLEMMRAADLYDVVEWAAAEPWCDGQIALTGISYAGMSALVGGQDRPPHLRAIAVMMAAIKTYEELAFPGGSANMLGVNGVWIGLMNMLELVPPLDHRDLPEWMNIWLERMRHFRSLNAIPVFHQLYDGYWEEYAFHPERIAVPLLIIDGWYGISHQSSFDMFSEVDVDAELIMGPWVHFPPILARSEAINYNIRLKEFFNRHLRGQVPQPANPHPRQPLSIYVPGGNFWKYEREWPPERAVEETWHLRPDRTLGAEAAEAAEAEGVLTYDHDAGVGVTAGLMLPFAYGNEYPREQSEDDRRSLSFDSAPLDADYEIAGNPAVTITCSTDMPDAAITVRLTDVAPDGKSAYITRGWLRLGRREGLDHAIPVEPGVFYTVTIRCQPIDYLLRRGHRLRLNIQLSDFPRLFPLPYTGAITLRFGGANRQTLKVRRLDGKRPWGAPHFRKYLAGIPGLIYSKTSGGTWDVTRDAESGKTTVRIAKDFTVPLAMLGTTLFLTLNAEATTYDRRPSDTSLVTRGEMHFTLAGKRYVIHNRQCAGSKSIGINIMITQDDKVIFEKDFSHRARINLT